MFVPTLIRVTKEDKKQGVPGDPEKCAIARAITRQVRAEEVSVAELDVQFFDSAGVLHYLHLPASAKTFIKYYDTRLLRWAARPFEFILGED